MNDLDDELVDFLYRWNRAETSLGFNIIDLDLLQAGDSHPGRFTDDAEALTVIRKMMDSVDASTDSYVTAKIIATEAFLRSLVEGPIRWGEYIERTLGVTPEPIAESDLQAQRDVCRELIEAFGCDLTAAGVNAWSDANTLGVSQIESDFTAAESDLIPAVKRAAGLDVDAKYKTELASEDAYWMAWTMTNDSGDLVIRFNTHERHKWIAGKPELLALHEIGGHALQASAWKRNVQSGKIPKSAGLVGIFTPDMFLLEGLADTLLWFCPDLPLTDEARWMIHRQRLQSMALNNAHIMANDGASEADFLAYMSRWAPGCDTDDNRAKEYDQIRNHLLLRGYLHAYGIGGWTHQQLGAQLDQEKRRWYLRRVYSGPIAPYEIIDW